MTTPLPTDEELEHWAKAIAVLQGQAAEDETAEVEAWRWSEAQSLEVMARLLTYVRHLRGEVEAWKERAEVSNLRKQLESERERCAKKADARKRAVQAIGNGPFAGADPAYVQACDDIARSIRAEVALTVVDDVGDPTDEEARLSDPKRHPFKAKLGADRRCVDCGWFDFAHEERQT